MITNRFASLMQAARGPLLLVTLGVLCELHETDTISFRYTWPVLIIMIGVLILIERAFAPAPVPPGFPNPAYSNPGAAGYRSTPAWNPPPDPRNPPTGPYSSGPQQGGPR
jgi:hypothetical protein